MIDLKIGRIFLKPGRTDMRKSINGLAVMAQEVRHENPLSGNLFLFCNGSRTRLKVLYWDRNGFCLWLKRLEKHKFPWPESSDDKRELSERELRMLLGGIDFFHAHETLTFSRIL